MFHSIAAQSTLIEREIIMTMMQELIPSQQSFLPPPPPPRYKTSFLAWIIICLISSPLNCALSPICAKAPKALHTAITSATTILLMNYIAMPCTMRLCARWLYRQIK